MLIILASVQFAVIAAWLWQHVEMGRIRREGLYVHRIEAAGSMPAVSVIIPARDEAARISECLNSLLSQDYPDLRIIVVDDRSSDGTFEIVQEAFAGDPRCNVCRIDELPGGWGGKSHALWIGAKRAETPWLVFIDADCRLEADGLASAMRYALDHGADLLSLWPRDASVGFWERLLLPLCGAMIVIWYGRRATHDPAAPVAFANGQFLLCGRDAYWSIGGHESVKDALVEDIPLAKHAKKSGLKVLSAIGTAIFSVRMYASLREIVSGWQRIYIGVLSSAQIALCALSIMVGSLPPFVLIPALSIAAHGPHNAWIRFFLVMSWIHLLALMTTSIRFFSIARCKLGYLSFYPFSCLGVLFILTSAFIRSFGKTEIHWRGTTYRVQRSSIRT